MPFNSYLAEAVPRFPDVAPNPKLEAQLEQARIFENITAFFRLLSKETPQLLVVEDVHWADSGTLLLLLHLARTIQNDAIMLIANYREVELDEGHPFHQVLLDINREHLATRIKLARLDRTQTNDLLTSMFDDETTPDFLEGVFHETEGNPFFIEEVCKALVETGKLYFEDGEWHRPSLDELEVPQSIRIAIQARVGKLDKDYQGVLKLAAVLGHEFDFEVLTAASPQDEDTLIDALEAAEKAQLIRANPKDGPNAFAFVHALIPSTVYDGINSLRRGRLHKRVAEAIKELRPNDLEELAYHYTGAGDLDNAVEYFQRAAQRAQEVFALDAAIGYLQTALDLVEPGEHDPLRIELLEQLGDIRTHFGQKPAAVDSFQQALEILNQQPNLDTMTDLRFHRKIVSAIISMNWLEDFERAKDAYEASIDSGLNLIKNQPPHKDIVSFLITLSKDAWKRRVPSDYKLAERYADKAMGIAKKLGDPEALSASLGALSAAYNGLQMYQKEVDMSRQRLQIIEEEGIDNRPQQIDALRRMGNALFEIGDLPQSITYLQRAEKLSEQIQAVYLQAWTMHTRAQVHYSLDQWDAVLEIETTTRAMEARYPNFFERAAPLCFQKGLAAAVHALRGDFENAAVLREESNAIMLKLDGPSERWGLGNYL